MPINPMEAITLGMEAEALAEFLIKSLKKDVDGHKRLDKAETRELLQRISTLAAHIARDMVD
jgi:hypothetical protein